jgi:hypothetical protein
MGTLVWDVVKKEARMLDRRSTIEQALQDAGNLRSIQTIRMCGVLYRQAQIG